MTFTAYSIKQWVIIGVISLCVVVGGYFGITYWYNATHLVVTRTQPKNNETAAAATPVIFWFSRPISTDTAKSFSISPNVPGQVTVSGNSLTFLPKSILANDQTYTATLSRAASADGNYEMGEYKFSFKIGEVPYDKQPQSVQDRALALTDNRPPDLVFFGDDELIKQGVTDDQLTNMESFMKSVFDKSQKKTDYVINIDNVTAAPYDSQSENPVQSFTFDMEMNDVTYKAKFDCSVFGSAHLYVYDQAGTLMWDSGKLGNDDYS